MEDFEEEYANKKIKTNDSKKKPVKNEKKKEDSKASPKRKNPPKKNNKKEDKKEEKPGPQKSVKKKDDSFDEAELLMMEEQSNSSEASDFDSKAKNKTTKQKPAKKNPKPKGNAGGGVVGGKDEATITVLEYLKKQNRPYSLLNILDNLHGEIKKTQGQKILDQLSEEGEIQMKEYGKSKIYLINQKNIPLVDPQEMENLKNQMNEKKIEHGNLLNDIKVLKKKEADINNQLNNEQLEQEIEKYVNLLRDCDEKIESYKSPSYVKIPDEVINQTESRKNKYEKEYKKRRRYCMDMINQLAEGMEKKPREIEEMIGIDRKD